VVRKIRGQICVVGDQWLDGRPLTTNSLLTTYKKQLLNGYQLKNIKKGFFPRTAAHYKSDGIEDDFS
jgi:hypothetical protein